MMQMKRIAAAGMSVGIVFTLPTLTLAQSNAADTDEEVIVRSTRIETAIDRVPGAVTVVGADDIQLARQQLALDESLSRVPGVYMQNRYDFSQDLRIAIRGFGSRGAFNVRGIKILVDGIPETMPDGFATVDTIDLSVTDSIEVLRGPSSTLYGNASGGVINVLSETPPEDGYAQVRISAGEYGFQKLQAKTAGSTERVGYLLSIMDSSFDGYRSHSAADSTLLTSRFNIDLGREREFIASLNYSDEPWSQDPGGINAAEVAQNRRMARDANVTFATGETAEQARVGFVYRAPLGENTELQARNYYLTREFGNRLPFAGGGQVEYDRSVGGIGLSLTHESELGGMANEVIFGFDIDDQDDDRVRFDNLNGVRGDLNFNQNESVKSQGFFVQDVLSLTDAIDLSLGLRFDEVEFAVTDYYLADGNDSGSTTVDDTSPMLGISVRLADNLYGYGTYSTAFETPTTTEYANPDGGGFNQSLEPQTAENFEIGMRGSFGMNHRFEVAVFDIDVEDELIQYELAAFPDRDFFRNAATSSRQGIEFALQSRPSERIRTSVSLTLADYDFDDFRTTDELGNVVDDFSGNRIPGIAEDVFFGEVSYNHPRGWFAIFDVMYAGEQFTTNDNSVPVDSYTVANLRFGWDQDLGNMQLRPFVGINNLFDELYYSNIRINPAFGTRFYEPAPDRNIYLGVTMDFGLN